MLGKIAVFVQRVYFPNQRLKDTLDLQRMSHFIKTSDINLRQLVISKCGLLQHIKRSCIQAGWIWNFCESNIEIPNSKDRGWKQRNGMFVPVWQENDVFDIASILKTCSCKKGACNNCSCQKSKMKCLRYCKCEREK